MSNDDDRSSLDKLGEKLQRAQAGRSDRDSGSASAAGTSVTSQVGTTYRVFVELLAGVVVGCGLGWFLDGQFGTKPWLLLAFLLLGIAAGFWNVIRTARRMAADLTETDRSSDQR
jgi:ATP synthase protein I